MGLNSLAKKHIRYSDQAKFIEEDQDQLYRMLFERHSKFLQIKEISTSLALKLGMKFHCILGIVLPFLKLRKDEKILCWQ